MENKELESELLNKTIELFNNRGRGLTIEKIHEDIPQLTTAWLSSFTREGLDPSIKRVETLYKYLIKMQEK